MSSKKAKPCVLDIHKKYSTGINSHRIYLFLKEKITFRNMNIMDVK